jgi:putative mRNA 3-end processing factor
MCAVELRRGGLHLTGTALALDARRKCELSFISHAHSDHLARHERVIATTPTLRFMAHRLGSLPAALPVPYNRPFVLGPLEVELLPAGHILGSAQIRITRADGRRVVYTGDLNVTPSLTAEPLQVARCDTLIVEATFGHPRYVFPAKSAVLEQLEAFLRRTLEAGSTPILLGYELGKAQEVMKFLRERGFALCAHSSICEISAMYGEFGVALDGVRRFNGAVKPGEVLVFPPRLARSPALQQIHRRSVAILTGWAVDPSRARWHGAAAAFPLSDHADFDGLMGYAKATGAREIITHSGFAEELAAALRKEGLEARALGKPLQLQLL